MAEFNLQYYSGTDYYSDGDVENRIEEAVNSNKEWITLVEECDKQDRYPFIYHLSPIRENILNWYNFKEGSEILEIGSGLGAITGALCKKAKKVVSVELSKRRAGINYARHKDIENLEIVVGNLNDLPVSKKYDYIVLNGVFEYAASFTQGDKPYETFLKNIIQYLKPEGVLLIAIENRLGIKYFAGAVEDHTNVSFLGIDGYKDNNTVKTFSKSEFENLFDACGLNCKRFYYPYPDYKFPLEIFTDDTVNNGSYGRKCHYFERFNKRLFDASHVCKTLANEGVMANFANSFLIEASASKLSEEVVIYTKLNGIRKDDTAIGTSILKNETDEKRVVKYALNDEANSHINNLYENTVANSDYLQGKKVTWSGHEGVEYPYLVEKPLSYLANEYVKNNRWNDLKALLISVMDSLLSQSDTRSGICTKEFAVWFGSERLEEEFECVKNCNIDLILDNIYQVDGKYVVIDCEWCPHFYVPKKFIIWRMINELFYQNHLLAGIDQWKDLMNQFGISTVEERTFMKWAIYFANEFVNDSRISKESVGESIRNITPYMKRKSISKIAQLYIDDGTGLSEDRKLWMEFDIEENGKFQVEFNLEELNPEVCKCIKAFRYDPIENDYIQCCDMSFSIDGKKVKYSDSNMVKKSDGIFETDDPQYWFKKIPKKPACFKVSGVMKFVYQNTI